MERTLVQIVEDYVKKEMTGDIIAHDFKHVDRVRNWALKIAKREGFADLELVEVTALLHDIGLAGGNDRNGHGERGAAIAGRFLRETGLMSEEKITQATKAIRHHSGMENGLGQLYDILRDADCMDAFGAMGIMRAFTMLPEFAEYDPENIRGAMWGMCGERYRHVFIPERERGVTLVDEINLQIHFYDNLSTESARELARPLVEFQRDFILQLESEILAGRER